MDKKINKITILDSTALFLIGVFLLGYLLFSRRFAELHIQLPFFNFPIFIGEILLFLCLVLFFIRLKFDFHKFTIWHYLFCSYFAFVLIKAFWGYIKWGPLALRHAALFYYPAFAIFGYVFYQKGFLNNKNKLILALLIFFLFRFAPLYESFTVTCFILSFVLIRTYPHRIARYLLISLFLILTPYMKFFNTSRTFLAANLAVGAYMIIALFFVLRVKKPHKLILMTLLAVFITAGVVRSKDRNNVKALIDFKRFLGMYNDPNEVIERAKDSFQMKEIRQIRLYNPEVKKIEIATATTATAETLSIPDNPIRAQPQIKEVEEKIKDLQLKVNKIEEKISKQLSVEEEPSAKIVKAVVPNKTEEAGALQEEVLLGKVGQGVKTEERQAEEKISKQLSVEEEPSAKIVKAVVPNKTEEAGALQEEVLLGKVGQGVNIAEAVAPKIEEAKTKANQLQFRIEELKLQSGETQRKLAVSRLELDRLGLLAKQLQSDINELRPEKETADNQQKFSQEGRNIGAAFSNSAFRIFMWRDLLMQLKEKKPAFGFDFGKPFRSISIEILNQADGEWGRDGWIEPHNSFLHILYRSGLLGILFIATIFTILLKMINKSIQSYSLNGILLCGILLNWLAAANFLPILELPYNAIPFWSLFGMAFAYLNKLPQKTGSDKEVL